MTAIATAVRFYGAQLDEIIVVVTDGLSVRCGMDETLVLNDASKEDAVIAVLSALSLTNVETRVEIALDYPSQQLAVGVWADTEPVLAEVVRTIQTAIKRELDLDAPTASELERRALAKQSA